MPDDADRPSEEDGPTGSDAPNPQGAQDRADGSAPASGTPDGGAGAAEQAASDGDSDGDSEKSAAAEPAGPEADAVRKRRRWPRVLAWTSAAMAVMMLAGAALAYGYYRDLTSDIVQHDLGSALAEEDRPEKIGDDVNILFIGSDGRENENAAYGGTDFVGERSDSLMLAHISPDDRVTVVNFPRDSLVQIPECDAYGETEGTAGYNGMINAALFHGGPPCVVKTIESLTDIRIDHFAHLNFVGFRDMVDAIGGVGMCIPEPMEDERSKLDLDAGQQVLDGEESLAFVRARYEIGNGGDIGRIDRQQMFLGALAAEIGGKDVLGDPGRLNGLLRAVTAHTATDGDFDLQQMVSIGTTLADVGLSEISFYTVPWDQAPFDPNRVIWREEDAARLFTAVKEDRPLDEAGLGGEDGGEEEEGEPDPSPSPESGLRPSPASTDGGALFQPVALDDSTDTGDDALDGRDATSNPCEDGLGNGTGDTEPAE